MQQRQIARVLSVVVLIGAAVAGVGIGTIAVERWVLPPLPADLSDSVFTKGRTVDGRRAGKAGRSSDGLTAELRHGPYRSGAVQVAGVRDDGSAELQPLDARTARRGFGATIRHALRQRGKAPKEERYARLKRHSSFGEDEEDSNLYPGDVFLSGIPMIDQGGRAYCAVASAARVLQGYGIEITMEDMAALAGSSETGGTNMRRWDQALRRVARAHGLELTVIPELTETKHPLGNLLYEYNQTARDMGYLELYPWNYLSPHVADYKAFWEDREYPVQREVMLSDDVRCDVFEENVTARIDESDPLFWSVTLGDVAEEVPYSDKLATTNAREAHMRLIIGYNEDRGEILYSDSWGEGHELKRMDADDALSITRGMYYLSD